MFHSSVLSGLDFENPLISDFPILCYSVETSFLLQAITKERMIADTIVLFWVNEKMTISLAMCFLFTSVCISVTVEAGEKRQRLINVLINTWQLMY